MSILVTGASGFSGRHMIRFLASLPGEPLEIYALSRSPAPCAEDGVGWIRTDLMNRSQVTRAVRDLRPEIVIHLAGINRGPLMSLLEANVAGTAHLLDAVLHEAPGARVLVVGSSAEYGYAGDVPIPETAPLRPLTPYGVSKAAQALLAIGYHTVHRLSVAVAVPFNLVGPGLPASFVTGTIVEQALEVARGERAVIELQGLDSRRDFVDVRDAVTAYWQILNVDGFEERVAGKKVNVGSGTSHSVAEVLDIVRGALGAEIETRLPAHRKPDTIPAQTADIGRLRDLIGWSPRIPLETSIRDMLAWSGAE